MKEEKLVKIIGEIGIEGARYIEENIDFQFFAIKKLYKNVKDLELVIKLVLLNSIVSYQINCTGEKWWMEFSKYFILNKNIKNVVLDYLNFLKNSRCNKRYLNIKIKRIIKISDFIEKLDLEKIDFYYKNMVFLRDDLSSYLKSNKSSKTICFSIKMFGYASRIIFKKFIPYPFEVDIPMDSRIKKYTQRFVENNFLEFWRKISYKSGVPPLHIDSILWPFLNKKLNLKCFKKLKNFNKINLIFDLLNIK
ncbi:MAG: N-glycosylase/DNA lyase [Nanoarchaeales archaeon]